MSKIMRSSDLVREGYEILRASENSSVQNRLAEAEVAKAYAKLAEALGDNAFLSVY